MKRGVKLKLNLLLEKNYQVQFQILEFFFSNGQEVSYKELSKELSVSAPTLQKEVQQLGHNLQEFHEEATIEFLENDRLCLTLPSDFSLQHFLFQTLSSAINFQLLAYLYYHQEESTTKMMIDLNLSEASLFRHIKAINLMLNEFDIQIKNRRMVGEEKQIRFFYFQFFLESYPNSEIRTVFKNPSLRNLIRVIETQFDVEFSDPEYWKLAIWFGIMQQRFDFRGTQQHDLSHDLMLLLENDRIYQMLRNILGRYQSRFAISWSDHEAVYLYLFLLSQGMIPMHLRLSSMNTAFFAPIEKLNQLVYNRLMKQNNLTLNSQPRIFSFLTSTHVRVAFFRGCILNSLLQKQGSFLSNTGLETANQCLLAVEKQLSRNLSKDEKKQVGYLYQLVIDWLNEKNQKEIKVGLLLAPVDLQRDVIYHFLRKQLIIVPQIKILENLEDYCDLLISSQDMCYKDYSYKRLFLLTGNLNQFEENRLKKMIEDIRIETLESELN